MCINGGLELAINADYIIATRHAQFNLLKYKVGFPLIDMGSLAIAKTIGVDNAIDLMKTGKTFSAKEALNMGLINEIVPTADLQSRVL